MPSLVGSEMCIRDSNKISKGFAYVTDGNKKPLTSVSQVKADDEMSLIIKDGTIKAKVVEVFQESKE